MLSVMLWVMVWVVAYCFTCWIVGFMLVVCKKTHHDSAIGLAFYAPIVPFVFLSNFIASVIYRNMVWQYQRKAKWIADALQRKGIKLHQFGFESDRYYDYNALDKACEVQAEVNLENVEAYREIYARAIKKFSWRWTPQKLCGSAFPQWPLNREWAQQNGVKEYFAEHFMPCINCPAKRSTGWHWGSDMFHTRPYHKIIQRIYRCMDETEKTFPGWLCNNCEQLLVGSWKSMMER